MAQDDGAVPTPESSSFADEAPELLSPELALESSPAPDRPELAQQLAPPSEGLLYVAALTGPPVSLPQPPSAPSARTIPSRAAGDAPERLVDRPPGISLASTRRPYVRGADPEWPRVCRPGHPSKMDASR